MPIGFVARHVRASQQVRHAGSCQSLARVEQPKVVIFGRSSAASCTEFNKAGVCAGFRCVARSDTLRTDLQSPTAKC
jgi:hypothetical protein